MNGRAVQIANWDRYEIFDPGVDRPLAELTKVEARAAFNRVMAAIPDRLSQLRSLLDANGVNIDEVGTVDEWFAASVQEDDAKPGRLTGAWYSVVNDIGLLLGEIVIASTNGTLRWEMIESAKNDMSFQRHVICGYKVANPRYYADFDYVIGVYGHRIVSGEVTESGLFERLVADSLEKARGSS